LHEADAPTDWWHGAPAKSRVVDTVYTGREGAITIHWPDTGLRATMTPGDNLPFTVVYTPAADDYICVEPVSHATDAVNRPDDASSGLVGLRRARACRPASTCRPAWIPPPRSSDTGDTMMRAQPRSSGIKGHAASKNGKGDSRKWPICPHASP
jgi:hypothetical protein